MAEPGDCSDIFSKQCDWEATDLFYKMFFGSMGAGYVAAGLIYLVLYVIYRTTDSSCLAGLFRNNRARPKSQIIMKPSAIIAVTPRGKLVVTDRVGLRSSMPAAPPHLGFPYYGMGMDNM